MKYSVGISSLTFSGGTRVAVPPKGIILIVGPNSAGKSRLLQEIETAEIATWEQPTDGPVLSEVRWFVEGDGDSFADWAENTLIPTGRADEIGLTYYFDGFGEYSIETLRESFNSGRRVFPKPLFLSRTSAADRISGCLQDVSISTESTPQSPIQWLSRNTEMADGLSKAVFEAFGNKVFVDTWNGPTLFLRIGASDRAWFDENSRLTEEGRVRLSASPRVDSEGDGVKNYIAILMRAMAGREMVTLLDEPEVFLHPPQAKRLASRLAELAHDRQFFIATHSTEFVKGVLDSQCDATIVRLTRDGAINTPRVLDHGSLNRLWDDPTIRYSNGIDSLFYDAAIICEANADCVFYASLLDEHFSSEHAPECNFVSAGGKDQLPILAERIRSAGVPVRVVADFDVLFDEAKLAKLCRSLSPEYNLDELHCWRTVRGALRAAHSQMVSTGQVIDAVTDTLTSAGREIDKSHARQAIGRALKSTWPDRKKLDGVGGFSPGDQTKAVRELLSELQRIGLYIVPVGEMESFDRDATGHAYVWVREVIRKLKEPGSTMNYELKKFIVDLASSLAEPTSVPVDAETIIDQP